VGSCVYRKNHCD